MASTAEVAAPALLPNGVLASGDVDEEFKENLSEVLFCPDCREIPPNLTEEFSSGDMVCTSCGLVVGTRIIDTRSEWRTFANDDQGNDDPSRVGDGPNELFEGSQLGTAISFEGKDARKLAHAQQKITVDKAAKDLQSAFNLISQYSEALNIGKEISDSTKYIYKLVDEAKILKGKSIESIVAGCLFISCRAADAGRTFKEVHALTRVSKKEIGRTFKTIESFLQRENKGLLEGGKNVNSMIKKMGAYKSSSSTGANKLCGRFCSQLRLRETKFENVSSALAVKSATVPDLAGRSPLSVAASCIYFASHLLGSPRSSKEIALIAGVSDGTIKTVYRFLYQDRDRLIEPEWLTKDGGDVSKLPTN